MLRKDRQFRTLNLPQNQELIGLKPPSSKFPIFRHPFSKISHNGQNTPKQFRVRFSPIVLLPTTYSVQTYLVEPSREFSRLQAISFQSGAPFTVLNRSDPAAALNGIDGLVGSAIRPNIASGTNLSGMTIPQIRAACGTPVTTGIINYCPNLFSITTQAQRVGNAGRNILRADTIEQIDFGIIKNTRITEKIRAQFRIDMFNAINHRNFGMPEGRANAANFLDQWGTNGGNRRIILGGRHVF